MHPELVLSMQMLDPCLVHSSRQLQFVPVDPLRLQLPSYQMHRLRVHWMLVLSQVVGMLCQLWLWLQRVSHLNLCNQVQVVAYQYILQLLCHLLKLVVCYLLRYLCW